MMVIVDYDSKVVYGPASYEMRMRWEKRNNAKYLDHFMFGYRCKIVLEDKIDEKTYEKIRT